MKPEKVYIFFEQSGTFKRAFSRRGVPAFDFDIDNRFGETDFQMDLFKEIESCFDSRPSIFDHITERDLIFAFFPCTFFSTCSQKLFSFSHFNYRALSTLEKARRILLRNEKRSHYLAVLLKLVSVVLDRKLPFVFENPWWSDSYLKSNFNFPPSFVHPDRSVYGDSFRKPTAYWVFNFKYPSYPPLPVPRHRTYLVKHKRGIDRSLISQEYANLFVDHYILGPHPHGFYQPDLL